MDLFLLLVIWFFFVGLSVYALKYIISGGKSFIVAIPSLVMLVVFFAMFPGVYRAYTGVNLWVVITTSMIAVAIFAAALFK